jgi:hypothetical protein
MCIKVEYWMLALVYELLVKTYYSKQRSKFNRFNIQLVPHGQQNALPLKGTLTVTKDLCIGTD